LPPTQLFIVIYITSKYKTACSEQNVFIVRPLHYAECSVLRNYTHFTTHTTNFSHEPKLIEQLNQWSNLLNYFSNLFIVVSTIVTNGYT